MLLAAEPALAEDASFAALERSLGGRVGFFARNVRTSAVLAWRADERFAMCSTFKAALAAAVLARVDQGRERLDRVVPYGPADLQDYGPTTRARLAEGGLPVADLCEAAVELSDNTAANLLLAQNGGPAALTAFVRTLDDGVTRMDRTEPSLNSAIPGDPRDTTTPRAMAGTLERLVLGQALSPASRERLTGWLRGCKTGDKRLRAGLPKAWVTADKTGASGHGDDGDIAVVWPTPSRPLVICAYLMGAKAPVEAQDAAFASLARMAAARLALRA
jgi:beta-lactamase class A